MRSHRAVRAAGLVLAAVVVGGASGCGAATAHDGHTTLAVDGTYLGSPTDVGNGEVRTYTIVDAKGEPTAVGIRMSATSLDGLPDSGASFMLHLPEAAPPTVFEHVMLNWNPRGHEPTILFGKPHFDMHFYMTDMASVEQIDPAASNYAANAAHLPEGQYMPRNYVTAPGALASQIAVPSMGVHWVDATDGMIPGVYDFTQTFINGSWNGEYTFMEPMMTRAWLLTRPTIREDIEQPQAYQHTAYYPTTYIIRFDDRTQEFDVSLADLVLRQSS